MNEGVKKNDAGMFEVFHCGRMIARVSTEKDAWAAYNRAYELTNGIVHELREAAEARREADKKAYRIALIPEENFRLLAETATAAVDPDGFRAINAVDRWFDPIFGYRGYPVDPDSASG